jgi:hypothetical protein
MPDGGQLRRAGTLPFPAHPCRTHRAHLDTAAGGVRPSPAAAGQGFFECAGKSPPRRVCHAVAPEDGRTPVAFLRLTPVAVSRCARTHPIGCLKVARAADPAYLAETFPGFRVKLSKSVAKDERKHSQGGTGAGRARARTGAHVNHFPNHRPGPSPHRRRGGIPRPQKIPAPARAGSGGRRSACAPTGRSPSDGGRFQPFSFRETDHPCRHSSAPRHSRAPG